MHLVEPTRSELTAENAGTAAAHLPASRAMYGAERLLTRSRFLGRLGTVLIGLASASLVKAQPALAHSPNPPACCGPSGRCSCCSGNTCCGGCTTRFECPGPSGYHWYCCQPSSPFPRYVCRDWWDTDGHRCTCASSSGFC
jgi:hypothetical protein